MKYLFLSLIIFSASLGFSQTDSLSNTSIAHPWAVKIDLTRFLQAIPSAQISIAYRHSKNWEYESEFNYYLKYENPKAPERILDPLLVHLDKGKLNFFVSGMAKRYLGSFYAGLRTAIGTANLQLERNICTKSTIAASGAICQCTEFETRHLDVKKSIRIFGLRLGYDVPIFKRVKIDTYIDVAGFSTKSNTTYESLRHQTSCTDIPYIWRNIYYPKLTATPASEGILDDLLQKKSNLIYSFGLKLGYAF